MGKPSRAKNKARPIKRHQQVSSDWKGASRWSVALARACVKRKKGWLVISPLR